MSYLLLFPRKFLINYPFVFCVTSKVDIKYLGLLPKMYFNIFFVFCQAEALGLGLQQVLWLFGDDHQLTEVGTMNIFVLAVNEKGG